MRRLSFLSLVIATVVNAADPLGLTEDEFKMYRHYTLALGDARVQKMKPDARLAAIAKDAGYKPKDLAKAIERAEAAGDVKAKCESNLKSALAGSEIGGQLGKLEVDTSAEHAVAYVQWFNEEPKNLPVEACFAAVRAAEACPIAATIQVWAQDRANPKSRVFQALISTTGAKRINADKVRDYAETRYLKLFEKVKSTSNGDDLSAELGVPASPGGTP